MFRSVRILVTDSCNLNCNYCHNEGILKGHSILGYEFFESFVEQISTIATVEKIILSGGEPLLHPRILEMIKLLVSKTDFQIALETNGTLLSKDILDVIEETGIKVIVSLPSLDPSRYLDITGGQNTSVLKYLREIGQRNIEFSLNAVFQSEYEKDLLEIIDYCQELSIDLKILPYYDIHKKNQIEISSQIAERMKLRLKRYNDNGKGSTIYYYENFLIRLVKLPCTSSDQSTCMNYGEVRLTPDLRLTPCIINSSSSLSIKQILSDKSKTPIREIFERMNLLNCQNGECNIN